MAMTREEFDKGLNEETILGITADRTKYTALRTMADGYKRPDLTAIIDSVRDSMSAAIRAVEALDKPKESN